MSLLECISSSAEIGPEFKVKTHIAGIWSTIGSCNYIQLTDSIIEVKGNASVLGISYDFDIIVTDGSSGPVLTVNGTVDDGATIDGCTVHAHSTLNGISVTFKSYEGKNTELETPSPYPNIFINPS